MLSPGTAYYFKRFGFVFSNNLYAPSQIAEPPHPNLGMVAVIPCFNEPNLLTSLQSLWRCERPESAVEVIVVINSSELSPPEVLEQNLRSLRDAESWSGEDCDRYFRIHLLHFPNLPRKHAGVGLARKIGMDEALRRFDAVNRLDGIITCFDADSSCDPNYLIEIENHFRSNPKSPGCSIYFEHPLEGSEPNEIYEAITLYELHLRYYVQALRFAGFPHAFHTIGSSMAVRADAYMKQGGMNKRQAGEDFYFLHKIIPLGHFDEVNSTRVIPSPRASDRVPFGTGRAVRDFLATRKFETYPFQAFHDLKQFFSKIEALSQYSSRPAAPLGVPPSGGLCGDLPSPLKDFLDKQNFPTKIAEIRAHTTTSASFHKRFFRWFDGFLAMKYIHFARDIVYGPAEIVPAACELLTANQSSPRLLLLRYRALQMGSATGF